MRVTSKVYYAYMIVTLFAIGNGFYSWYEGQRSFLFLSVLSGLTCMIESRKYLIETEG